VPTLKKIYIKMVKAESLKTLPPKYTKALKRLARYLGLEHEAAGSSIGEISAMFRSKRSDSLQPLLSSVDAVPEHPKFLNDIPDLDENNVTMQLLPQSKRASKKGFRTIVHMHSAN